MRNAGQTAYGVTLRPTADERTADRLLEQCRALGANRVRVELSLGQADDDAARERLQRMLARAAESFSLIAAFHRPRSAQAPVAATDAAGYRAAVIRLASAVGAHCRWFELADPLGPVSWPDLSAASGRLLRDLCEWIGTPVSLGGLPLDPAWLAEAGDRGLLEPFGALGFSDAATLETDEPHGAALASARAICDRQALWLTPDRFPGVAAGRGDVQRGARLVRTADWLESDSAQVFLPLADMERGGALAGRLLRGGGSARLRDLGRHQADGRPADGYDLVTGGAGFVGSNLAARLAGSGRSVLLLDNLARAGTEENLEWLRSRFPDRIHFTLADIRDREAVVWAAAGAERVFHLAAQVAVTTSLEHPHEDHAVNTAGTLNLLEALRGHAIPPPLILTSTNKVYGGLGGLTLRCAGHGYEPVDDGIRGRGLGEDTPLALSSPYGCSKGAADQYALDYAHSFGLPTAAFRMSCIYGPRQFGNEDQGWVAHFVRQALRGGSITIYGDGQQVRDLLFVDDLVDALLAAMDRLPAIAGQAFNIGGGVGREISLNGLLSALERLHGDRPAVRLEDWRAGDQRYYVSDIGRFRQLTGWRPRIEIAEGLQRLYTWMREREHVAADRRDAANHRMAL